MLSLPPSVRIFVCTEPTDMRKSFDGLFCLIEEVLDEDPLSGHLFVFRNRRGDRLKILFWDRTGFWIHYKRLECGTFRLPESRGAKASIEGPDLMLMLEGIDLSGARRRKRWRPGRKRRSS